MNAPITHNTQSDLNFDLSLAAKGKN